MNSIQAVADIFSQKSIFVFNFVTETFELESSLYSLYFFKMFKSVLLKESFCACLYSRHYGLPMARRALKNFFVSASHKILCVWAGIFDIFMNFFLKKFKTAIFCDFFHFELFFSTF